jgi:molybdenum-dependent DNA-binding transcriptional regulator ModE
MGYKRAWYLIDAMNRSFQPPVVHASNEATRTRGAVKPR